MYYIPKSLIMFGVSYQTTLTFGSFDVLHSFQKFFKLSPLY